MHLLATGEDPNRLLRDGRADQAANGAWRCGTDYRPLKATLNAPPDPRPPQSSGVAAFMLFHARFRRADGLDDSRRTVGSNETVGAAVRGFSATPRVVPRPSLPANHPEQLAGCPSRPRAQDRPARRARLPTRGSGTTR